MMRDETEKTPHFRFDWDRQARTGMAEAVLCEGKTCGHLSEILMDAKTRQVSLLLTRLSTEAHAELGTDHHLDYCALSRTAILGAMPPPREIGLGVALVCAGTSDLEVLTEAQRTLEFNGIPNKVFADVGVAGLWRIMSVAEELSQYRVLIAVAGMEGALFSVLAGLVPGLVIAVPSSVGYGVSADGKAALSSALSSCSPGLVTVNIDNGFGAAAAAIKLLRQGTSGSPSVECPSWT